MNNFQCQELFEFHGKSMYHLTIQIINIKGRIYENLRVSIFIKE